MSSSNNAWFILMGDQKYGPYDYKVIIQMLQSHQLMDYNYVWAPHLSSWTQVGQLPDFSKERFQELIEKESDVASAFFQRKNIRVNVNVPILGHNHIRFFDGQLVSVSKAGGLCLINSPLVQVGDKLKIHFKQDEKNSVAFNVECEVVRKNFSKQRLNSKSGLYYAIRFYDIQPVGVGQIQDWIELNAA